MPIWSIACSTVISLLLTLINIGSTVAFNAFKGLVIADFYSSFLIAASLILLKRLTKQDIPVRWGPFTLGRAGNLLLSHTVLLVYFFSFWPPGVDPTPTSMNWSLAVYGGVLLFSFGFWVVHGRKMYTGPI